MMRLILFAGIVCCIAYLSPTRERSDVAAELATTLNGVETLAEVAASPLGRHAIEEAIRRPHAPAAAHADRLANAPKRPYK